MTHGAARHVTVRDATHEDLARIAEITVATGQDEEWAGSNPDYVRHLMRHGQVVVAEGAGEVAGFGAVLVIGTGPSAISMLCDLFVDPSMHGRGWGRAMLAELWRDQPRRMTFSSLHANAVPLYTSFGLDAWWPLLYLYGGAGSVAMPDGWSVEQVTPDEAGQAEQAWTGTDRTEDHRAWSRRPNGVSATASYAGELMAVGTFGGQVQDFGITHLAISPAADDEAAASAVLAAIAGVVPPGDLARVTLPAPHPAVRSLLPAGWRFDEFDLFMATDPSLLDPRRAVPSPGQA